MLDTYIVKMAYEYWGFIINVKDLNKELLGKFM